MVLSLRGDELRNTCYAGFDRGVEVRLGIGPSRPPTPPSMRVGQVDQGLQPDRVQSALPQVGIGRRSRLKSRLNVPGARRRLADR